MTGVALLASEEVEERISSLVSESRSLFMSEDYAIALGTEGVTILARDCLSDKWIEVKLTPEEAVWHACYVALESEKHASFPHFLFLTVFENLEKVYAEEGRIVLVVRGESFKAFLSLKGCSVNLIRVEPLLRSISTRELESFIRSLSKSGERLSSAFRLWWEESRGASVWKLLTELSRKRAVECT